MGDGDEDEGGLGGYASPPCYAHEIDPTYFDPLGADPQQARDVARWRKAERERLRVERMALGVEERRRIAEALTAHLDALIHTRFGGPEGRTISAYWPIKGEFDLRGWMAALHQAGATIALPVVETVRAPLVFRVWTPETAMERGHWNILVPPASAPATIPEIALAPLVGWDGEGYRLGYGGGYFDRTLAALAPKPFAIGVGWSAARLATIYPQPHDVRLDAIVTERGVELAP